MAGGHTPFDPAGYGKRGASLINHGGVRRLDYGIMRWRKSASDSREEREKVSADAGLPAERARSSMSVLRFGK